MVSFAWGIYRLLTFRDPSLYTESQWTFGQILPVVLLIAPVLVIISALSAIFSGMLRTCCRDSKSHLLILADRRNDGIVGLLRSEAGHSAPQTPSDAHGDREHDIDLSKESHDHPSRDFFTHARWYSMILVLAILLVALYSIRFITDLRAGGASMGFVSAFTTLDHLRFGDLTLLKFMAWVPISLFMTMFFAILWCLLIESQFRKLASDSDHSRRVTIGALIVGFWWLIAHGLDWISLYVELDTSPRSDRQVHIWGTGMMVAIGVFGYCLMALGSAIYSSIAPSSRSS